MTSNTSSNPPKHEPDCPYNYGHNCSCLPSTRPMTLRQQLAALDIDFGYAVGNLGEDCKDDTVDKIIAMCQEIAREARRDELLTVHSNEHEFGLGEASTRMHERIAELTQKPPQPQGADSHTDTGDTVSGNEADNLSPGANGADNTKFPYYCPVCGEGYTQMLYRDNHVANKHTKGTDLVPPDSEANTNLSEESR